MVFFEVLFGFSRVLKLKAITTAISVISIVRNLILGSFKPRLLGVYVAPEPSVFDVTFQDLVQNANLGLIDVTSNYTHRLSFQDSKTLIHGVGFTDVWRALVRNTQDFHVYRPGRVEVNYIDHFGVERCVLYTKDTGVQLPLTKPPTTLMAPSLMKCTVSVQCRDIDDTGEEISLCDETLDSISYDAVDVDITKEVKKWIPNYTDYRGFPRQKVLLSLRDAALGDNEFSKLFKRDSPYEKFSFLCDVKLSFANEDVLTRETFSWEVYPGSRPYTFFQPLEE